MLRAFVAVSAVAAVILTGGFSSACAATLTNVPMQGGMVMPMLSYNASDGTLKVQLDPTVPQLTPLLVSNPADGFDPADPWYDALDPTRQGLSFSRRYGFVMATMTDPLPAGFGIRIRKLSSSQGLGLYRCHMMSLPKRWEPIFGTAGTSNEFSWSGTMFHPCAVALPGTNTYAATFEAFLVVLDTGLAVPGSSTGPFTLNWTNVPDGRPALDVGMKLVVTCPADTAGYVLESADAFPASDWTPVPDAPVTLNDRPTVVLEPGARAKFFRMRKSP